MHSLTIEDLPYAPDSSPLFERIRPLSMAVFLDSANPYNQQGRYDIISAAPLKTIKQKPLNTNSYKDKLNYFEELKLALSEIENNIENPLQLPFIGGAIGYFGYDLGRQLEKLPSIATDDSKLAVACTGIYSWAIISDHHLKKTHLVIHPQTPSSLKARIKEQLSSSINKQDKAFKLDTKFKGCMSKQSYKKAFNQVKDYIDAGDCYQINLAQRFSSYYSGDSWTAYKRLRTITAAPFSAFLDYGEASILSLSPERFLQLTNNQVNTSPIKGTATRSQHPDEDKRLGRQLLNSSKDRAENLMIVDLLRNDLGKNCEPGSIKVDKLFELQSFKTVHHLVSTISGTLKKDTHPIDLLAGSFPGGSITGAPKIRAMEIIEELESHRRSVYCGSIGYVSCDGQMDTNIAIRTLTCSDQSINCWAGGGIVADSECESEYQECFAKVGKIMQALEDI